MKNVLLAVMLLLAFSLCAQENALEGENEARENVDFDKTGVILSLSAFNYFQAGVGFNCGSWKRAGDHFAGSNYGVLIEYKTIKEVHLRFYGNIYGGSSAMHMGVSGVLSSDFTDFSAGLAPEVGLGVPGGNLFYRYNFYLNSRFNCHEIVLLIYPINKVKLRKAKW
jgi:hypothetical protein